MRGAGETRSLISLPLVLQSISPYSPGNWLARGFAGGICPRLGVSLRAYLSAKHPSCIGCLCLLAATLYLIRYLGCKARTCSSFLEVTINRKSDFHFPRCRSSEVEKFPKSIDNLMRVKVQVPVRTSKKEVQNMPRSNVPDQPFLKRKERKRVDCANARARSPYIPLSTQPLRSFHSIISISSSAGAGAAEAGASTGCTASAPG